MPFKVGHEHYTTKGDFKKGHIPWNKDISAWLEKECSYCGKSFKIRKCHITRSRGKYCSKECRAESTKGRIAWNRKEKIIKVCKQCSKEFEIRPCENYRKFCSKKCVDSSRVGKKRTPFTDEHKRKIGTANKGNGRWGEESNHWKGGISPLVAIFRTLEEYNEWRIICLERDWFKCQDCNSKIKLEVHHIKSFTILVREFLEIYNQFSHIEDREILTRLAIKYEPFWDIENGKTLCAKCHKSLRRIKCQ